MQNTVKPSKVYDILFNYKRLKYVCMWSRASKETMCLRKQKRATKSCWNCKNCISYHVDRKGRFVYGN